MKLIGDVVQYLFHVLLVNSYEVIQDDGRSHLPEPLCELVDTADSIDVIWIAGLKTIVYQQRCD